MQRSTPVKRLTSRRARIAVLLCAALLAVPARASLAQDTTVAVAARPAPTDTATPRGTPPRDAADRAPLVTTRETALGAGFAVATAALMPFDQRVAISLQRPGLQQHAALSHAATGLELLAIPGVFLGSGAAFLAGRVEHRRSLADVGLHVGEASVVATALTEVLKSVAGRARPYVSHDTNPHDFGFGRGLTKGEDYSAFPSAHATVAFAAATALTEEITRWRPQATRVVAPLAYGGATLVGLARMYHDQHWASDVVLGAGVGTLSGLAVVRRQHARPRNWIDRTLLGAVVTPVPGGLAVRWSVPADVAHRDVSRSAGRPSAAAPRG